MIGCVTKVDGKMKVVNLDWKKGDQGHGQKVARKWLHGSLAAYCKWFYLSFDKIMTLLRKKVKSKLAWTDFSNPWKWNFFSKVSLAIFQVIFTNSALQIVE